MKAKTGIVLVAALALGLSRSVLAETGAPVGSAAQPAADTPASAATPAAGTEGQAAPTETQTPSAEAHPATEATPEGTVPPSEDTVEPSAQQPASPDAPAADGEAPAETGAADPASADGAPATGASPATDTPAEGAAPVAGEPEVDMVAQLAAAPVDPNACEIHIWTKPAIAALTTGWMVGFGVVGAIADSAGHVNINDANKADLTRLLTQNAQLAAISKIDFRGVLGDKPVRLIPETSELDLGKLDDDKGRKTASTHPCYYEFVAKVVFYQKAAMYGRRLISTFVLREFGASEKMTRYYKGTDAVGLELFPVEKIEDLPAATKEVLDAYAFAANKVIQKRRKK